MPGGNRDIAGIGICGGSGKLPDGTKFGTLGMGMGGRPGKFGAAAMAGNGMPGYGVENDDPGTAADTGGKVKGRSND